MNTETNVTETEVAAEGIITETDTVAANTEADATEVLTNPVVQMLPMESEATSVTTTSTPVAPVVQMLPIGSVISDPNQPRQFFDPVELKQLADSIQAHGIINPITTRLTSDGTVYVVAGEQRLRAAKLLELTEVPCIMIETPKYAEVALIENFNRSDLTAIEKAEALQRIVDSGVAKKDIAARLGKTPATISDILSLLKLKPEIKAACRNSRDFAIRELKKIAVAPKAEQDKMFQKYQAKMKVNMRLGVNQAAARGTSIEKSIAMLAGQLGFVGTIEDHDEQEKVLSLLRDLIARITDIVTQTERVADENQSPEE